MVPETSIIIVSLQKGTAHQALPANGIDTDKKTTILLSKYRLYLPTRCDMTAAVTLSSRIQPRAIWLSYGLNGRGQAKLFLYILSSGATTKIYSSSGHSSRQRFCGVQTRLCIYNSPGQVQNEYANERLIEDRTKLTKIKKKLKKKEEDSSGGSDTESDSVGAADEDEDADIQAGEDDYEQADDGGSEDEDADEAAELAEMMEIQGAIDPDAMDLIAEVGSDADRDNMDQLNAAGK